MIHRDVSIQNILTGKPGAEPGHRGILIDLDLAIRYLGNGNDTLANWRIVRILSALILTAWL